MRRGLKVFYEYAALYGSLGLLGCLCLAWSVMAPPLRLLLPRRTGIALGRWVPMAGFRFYAWTLQIMGAYRLDLSELDSLRNERCLILAPNHPTLIDAPLILTCHPNIVCVMKSELERNVFFGAGARLADYINNQSPRPMVKESIAQLRQGSVLLLFPEGTRTVRDPINPLSRSLGLIAKQACAPVQALIVETDSPFLSKGWPLFKRPSLPITCRVRLGRCFPPPTDAEAFTAALDGYFRSVLRGTLLDRWLPNHFP